MSEINLYDSSGHPVAYFADDSETIYTWDGHAVAYTVGENLYGWNGHHIGWYVNQVIYDRHGSQVGFTSQTCPYATYAAPAKYAKYAKYSKYARHAAYARPALSQSNSRTALADFLRQD